MRDSIPKDIKHDDIQQMWSELSFEFIVPEESDYRRRNRWYDEDPFIRQAVSLIHSATDENRVKFAIWIVKTIISKNVAMNKYEGVNQVMDALYAGYYDTRRFRWYDRNATLRTAMKMWEDCPKDLQKYVARVVHKLASQWAIFPL